MSTKWIWAGQSKDVNLNADQLKFCIWCNANQISKISVNNLRNIIREEPKQHCRISLHLLLSRVGSDQLGLRHIFNIPSHQYISRIETSSWLAIDRGGQEEKFRSGGWLTVDTVQIRFDQMLGTDRRLEGRDRALGWPNGII